ncbi:phosphoribosyl-AMP cyclohydrolase, partial [Escherichia coli]|nr:phosphoribosyl-AMP cyclohydrolase [Escherichia coli]
RRSAFSAALDLPVAPAGYREDMLRCLGLRPGSTLQLWEAAARLVTGTLPLIRPYGAEIARAAGPDLVDALVDGRLDRYVDQLGRPGGGAPSGSREPAGV